MTPTARRIALPGDADRPQNASQGRRRSDRMWAWTEPYNSETRILIKPVLVLGQTWSWKSVHFAWSITLNPGPRIPFPTNKGSVLSLGALVPSSLPASPAQPPSSLNSAHGRGPAPPQDKPPLISKTIIPPASLFGIVVSGLFFFFFQQNNVNFLLEHLWRIHKTAKLRQYYFKSLSLRPSQP